MSSLTTRAAAVDVLTAHRHGERKEPCGFCAAFYGDILDRLIAAGVLVDADSLEALADRWTDYAARDLGRKDYRGGYSAAAHAAANDLRVALTERTVR